MSIGLIEKMFFFQRTIEEIQMKTNKQTTTNDKKDEMIIIDLGIGMDNNVKNTLYN